MLHAFRRDWLSNTRGDLLSGLVVALALIPEAIAFSIIAGVDPKVGLILYCGCYRIYRWSSRNDLSRHRCNGTADGDPC